MATHPTHPRHEEGVMNIGKAAKASKVSAKMIRYYERIGLIPRQVGRIRLSGSHRADVNQLHFTPRDLGTSLLKSATY